MFLLPFDKFFIGTSLIGHDGWISASLFLCLFNDLYYVSVHEFAIINKELTYGNHGFTLGHAVTNTYSLA